MSNTNQETALRFAEMHSQVMEAADTGQAPLVLAAGESTIEINALAADPRRRLPAAIFIARYSFANRTASLAAIEHAGDDAAVIITEGSHGTVVRQPDDQKSLVAYLAGNTPRSTLDEELAEALLAEAEGDIRLATAILHEHEIQ